MNLKEFADSFPKRANVIGQALKEARDELVLEAFEAIVDYSPVLTGSYRARHQIAQGSTQGALIFEHPSKPPIEGIKTLATVIPAPDIGAVVEALQGIGPFERVVIFNDIVYARAVEYGTATMPPRLVYEETRIELELAAPARFATAIKKAIEGLR